ncbi:MAG: TetR/AcrR family transcriptional regulator [Ktedonobacteraceae bacterium]
MADALDPIQELLVQARRAQILDAATKVFAEKGFHRATIKDIARTAGIADGTIYTYFANKTALLIGLLNRLNETEQRASQFSSGAELNMRSFFVSYLRQRLAILWPNVEVFQAVLPEMLVNAELRDLYYQQIIAPTISVAEHYFEAQIQQGQIRKVDIPLTVRAIASTILGLLIMQLLGDQEIASQWEELPEVLCTMIFDGLKFQNDQL